MKAGPFVVPNWGPYCLEWTVCFGHFGTVFMPRAVLVGIVFMSATTLVLVL